LEYKYFDEELYKNRYVIERANAWQDPFKALLVRYETKNKTWISLLFLSFIVLFYMKNCQKIQS
jgi:hypothetical protein